MIDFKATFRNMIWCTLTTLSIAIWRVEIDEDLLATTKTATKADVVVAIEHDNEVQEDVLPLIELDLLEASEVEETSILIDDKDAAIMHDLKSSRKELVVTETI